MGWIPASFDITSSPRDPGVQRSHSQRYPTPDTRTQFFVTDSRPSGSLLRTMRGGAAPPLVSLPLSKPSEVHGNSIWYAPSNLPITLEGLMLRYRSDESLVYDHHEQGYTSHRDPEESFHAAFWETAGWTPEDRYQGWREEGYSTPPHLKGRGRARMYGPDEGEGTPKERDSPGWGSP